MELAKIPATLFNRCLMIYGVFISSDASGSPLSRSIIEAPPGHRHKKRKMDCIVQSCFTWCEEIPNRLAGPTRSYDPSSGGPRPMLLHWFLSGTLAAGSETSKLMLDYPTITAS